MKNYNFEPIKALTIDVIDRLVIHSTLGSLHRAAKVTPHMIKVDGDETIPTLYYIKGSMNPKANDWTVHALVSDVNKFLLFGVGSSNALPMEPATPLFIRSTIKWDGVTGKTLDGNWIDPINFGENNEELRFSGVIAWYDTDENLGRLAGNRVGAVIIPSQEMLVAYPDAEVYIESLDKTLTAMEAFYEYEDLGYDIPALYYYPLIKVPGQTDVVRIYWDKQRGIVESFPIIILQDAILEHGLSVLSSADEFLESIMTGNNVSITSDVNLTGCPAIITNKTVVDLNGFEVTGGIFSESNGVISEGNSDSYAFLVNKGGSLVLQGDGKVSAQAARYSRAVWANGGDVIIHGGTYSNTGNGSDLIYVSDGGSVSIYDGEFIACENQDGAVDTDQFNSALNIKDADRATSSITVYGGRFYKFDPSDCMSEGEHTNFVAEGYESIKEGDWYVVKPIE